MTTTNEEKLEIESLAYHIAINANAGRLLSGGFQFSKEEFNLFARLYTSAIEEKHQAHVKDLQHIIEEENKDHIEQQEKHQAQIATLLETVVYARAILAKQPGMESVVYSINHTLEKYQQDADAFATENKVWILEKAAAICSETFDYRLAAVARVLTERAAELRNQAQAEGKEGGE